MKKTKRDEFEICDAIKRTSGMLIHAAKVLGISRTSIYRYVSRYAAVKECLEEEREYFLDQAELALHDAISKGEPWAIKLLLLGPGKSRGFSYRNNQTYLLPAESADFTIEMSSPTWEPTGAER